MLTLNPNFDFELVFDMKLSFDRNVFKKAISLVQVNELSYEYSVIIAAILVWKMRLSNISLQRIVSMQEIENLRKPHPSPH